MKKVTVCLVNDKTVSSVMDKRSADEILDQFYKLSTGEMSGCLEFHTKDENGNTQNALINYDKVTMVIVKEHLDETVEPRMREK